MRVFAFHSLHRLGQAPGLRLALCFCCFSLFALTLQVLNGSYSSDIGWECDDASHYMNGLLILDYVVQGAPTHPMSYAMNYYGHYPKLAIGNWPPLFYVIEAGWMVLVGDSLTGVLVLMALVGASVALVMTQVVSRERRSLLAGILIGLMFLLLPVVQSMYATVMLDIPIALLSLLAAISFGNYLEQGRKNQLVLFGFFTVSAILTKGSGYALALVPPLAILFAKRFVLFRRPELWITAAVILALCLPWNVAMREINRATFGHNLDVAWFQASIPYYVQAAFFSVPGMAVGLLCLTGLCSAVWANVKGTPLSGTKAAIVALFLGTIVFMMSVPVSLENRFLLGAVPAIILLALDGAALGLRIIAKDRLPGPIGAWSAALLLLLFLVSGFHFQPRHGMGYKEVASFLAQDAELRGRVILAASERCHDGMLITAVAERDSPRPQSVVLRANRVLMSGDWNNTATKLVYDTPSEVQEFLLSVPVGVIVLERESQAKPAPYNEQVEMMLKDYPSLWTHIATFPRNLSNGGARLEVYKLINRDATPRFPITIDVRGTMRERIVIRGPHRE